MDTRAVWDLLAQREATATAAAETLRAQIAALSEQLAHDETELADLATTRKTLMALTGEPDPAPQSDPTIATVAYQQILAAFSTATGGMRAKDVCLALGLGTTPKDTEGLRAKLKRLVTRQILTESEPGLFTLTAATPSTQDNE